MQTSATDARPGQAGFTLIEALAAMVILTFGLMAVTNLMLIAGTSNTVANRSSAATMAASRQLEILKSLTWAGAAPTGLNIPGVGVTQGDVETDQPGFWADVRVAPPGVGAPVPDTPVRVRWEVTGIDAAADPTPAARALLPRSATVCWPTRGSGRAFARKPSCRRVPTSCAATASRRRSSARSGRSASATRCGCRSIRSARTCRD